MKMFFLVTDVNFIYYYITYTYNYRDTHSWGLQGVWYVCIWVYIIGGNLQSAILLDCVSKEVNFLANSQFLKLAVT